MFTRYYMSKFDEKLFNHDEFCVVSPDVGSVARSRTFAAKVHMDLAIVDKRRQRANHVRGHEHHRRRRGQDLHPV